MRTIAAHYICVLRVLTFHRFWHSCGAALLVHGAPVPPITRDNFAVSIPNVERRSAYNFSRMLSSDPKLGENPISAVASSISATDGEVLTRVPREDIAIELLSHSQRGRGVTIERAKIEEVRRMLPPKTVSLSGVSRDPQWSMSEREKAALGQDVNSWLTAGEVNRLRRIVSGADNTDKMRRKASQV